VEQELGRHLFFELQIDRDAVPLVGPDQVAGVVEREPLLVVRLDALDEFVVGDGEPGPGAGGQQVVHGNPPTRLKRQAQGVGRVAQVFRQELAHSD
jgi:hypothetical protein